jgi:hypothetical protein
MIVNNCKYFSKSIKNAATYDEPETRNHKPETDIGI